MHESICPAHKRPTGEHARAAREPPSVHPASPEPPTGDPRPACPAIGDSYSERISVYAHASSIEMLVELVRFVDSHDLQDLDQLLLFADLIKYSE